MNYYELLGISIDANDIEIKENYRKLVIKYHPDRNSNDSTSEEMFRRIREAYETLSDKNKRIQYDKTLNKQINKKTKVELNTEYDYFSKNPNDIKKQFENFFKFNK